MKIPRIKGIIDRRILINYRIDKEILRKYLPEPFEPIEKEKYGIAGICLIRLKEIRPVGIPSIFGISSENGAHRIAVKWKEKAGYKEGVYIPRRDTSSKINSITGGRIFPGTHYLSRFQVEERENRYKVSFRNRDGTELEIFAETTTEFSKNSVFNSLEEVSMFFENGSIGYSPNKEKNFDCLELKTYTWKVEPLKVKSVKSSFFENKKIFPEGSIEFDNALLMKNIEHEWNMKSPIKKYVNVILRWDSEKPPNVGHCICAAR